MSSPSPEVSCRGILRTMRGVKEKLWGRHFLCNYTTPTTQQCTPKMAKVARERVEERMHEQTKVVQTAGSFLAVEGMVSQLPASSFQLLTTSSCVAPALSNQWRWRAAGQRRRAKGKEGGITLSLRGGGGWGVCHLWNCPLSHLFFGVSFGLRESHARKRGTEAMIAIGC